MPDRRLPLLGLLLGVLAACATPASQFAAGARAQGLVTERVQGTAFTHSLFVRPGAGRDAALHVYLGGDGTPAVLGLPTDDPTPRDPLMLRLLALDPGPALYLGRPCYHGDGSAAACVPALWNEARYSEPVVVSMAAALQAYLRQHPAPAIRWFGYSGGGALAMLLAERFPSTEAVITIAGNLDLGAFAERNGRNMLAASLDPAARPALPPTVRQRHYRGTEDRVIPVSARVRQIAVDGFDHRCCWEAVWPALLSR